VVGSGAVNPRGVGGSFRGSIADVEVDPENRQSVGAALHGRAGRGESDPPQLRRGANAGGSAQGIGWALNEEYYVNPDGAMMNSSLLDYRMPTSLDLPMIDTVIVEVANPGHPYGVRGVGEPNIVAPPATIANAIYHAIGVRMNRLPMKPSSVMEALWQSSISPLQLSSLIGCGSRVEVDGATVRQVIDNLERRCPASASG